MKYVARFTTKSGTTRAKSTLKFLDNIEGVILYAESVGITADKKLVESTLNEFGKYSHTMRVPREVGRRHLEIIKMA